MKVNTSPSFQSQQAQADWSELHPATCSDGSHAIPRSQAISWEKLASPWSTSLRGTWRLDVAPQNLFPISSTRKIFPTRLCSNSLCWLGFAAAMVRNKELGKLGNTTLPVPAGIQVHLDSGNFPLSEDQRKRHCVGCRARWIGVGVSSWLHPWRMKWEQNDSFTSESSKPCSCAISLRFIEYLSKSAVIWCCLSIGKTQHIALSLRIWMGSPREIQIQQSRSLRWFSCCWAVRRSRRFLGSGGGRIFMEFWLRLDAETMLFSVPLDGFVLEIDGCIPSGKLAVTMENHHV